jgi:hypothetical protein
MEIVLWSLIEFVLVDPRVLIDLTMLLLLFFPINPVLLVVALAISAAFAPSVLSVSAGVLTTSFTPSLATSVAGSRSLVLMLVFSFSLLDFLLNFLRSIFFYRLALLSAHYDMCLK